MCVVYQSLPIERQGSLESLILGRSSTETLFPWSNKFSSYRFQTVYQANFKAEGFFSYHCNCYLSKTRNTRSRIISTTPAVEAQTNWRLYTFMSRLVTVTSVWLFLIGALSHGANCLLSYNQKQLTCARKCGYGLSKLSSLVFLLVGSVSLVNIEHKTLQIAN